MQFIAAEFLGRKCPRSASFQTERPSVSIPVCVLPLKLRVSG